MFAKFLFTLKDLLAAVVAALAITTQYVQRFTELLEQADQMFKQASFQFDDVQFDV